MAVDHLIKPRNILDDRFNLPSVALCGVIHFPIMEPDLPECEECSRRLAEIGDEILHEEA